MGPERLQFPFAVPFLWNAPLWDEIRLCRTTIFQALTDCFFAFPLWNEMEWTLLVGIARVKPSTAKKHFFATRTFVFLALPLWDSEMRCCNSSFSLSPDQPIRQGLRHVNITNHGWSSCFFSKGTWAWHMEVSIVMGLRPVTYGTPPKTYLFVFFSWYLQ